MTKCSKTLSIQINPYFLIFSGDAATQNTAVWTKRGNCLRRIILDIHKTIFSDGAITFIYSFVKNYHELGSNCYKIANASHAVYCLSKENNLLNVIS